MDSPKKQRSDQVLARVAADVLAVLEHLMADYVNAGKGSEAQIERFQEITDFFNEAKPLLESIARRGGI